MEKNPILPVSRADETTANYIIGLVPRTEHCQGSDFTLQKITYINTVKCYRIRNSVYFWSSAIKPDIWIDDEGYYVRYIESIQYRSISDGVVM